MNAEIQLLRFIERGNKTEVEEYVLKNGIPKDSTWIDYTLLRTAVRKNYLGITQILIEQGCRVMKSVKNSIHSLLHIAVENESVEMINLLLKSGASFTQKNRDGETALTFGIRSMIKLRCVDVKVLDILLENGADINTCIEDGTTLLHHATLKGDEELVEFLTKRKADVNCVDKIHGVAPLHIAVRKGAIRIAKLLLEHGADINLRSSDGQSPLHIAGVLMKKQMIDVLLLSQSDLSKLLKQVDDFGFSHLHAACVANNWSLVSSLLENGEAVNQSVSEKAEAWAFHTPMSAAIISNSEETVRTLLNFNADINPELGKTLIQLAVEHLSKEMLDLIVASGVDVNAYSEDGSTALHYAVKQRKLETVKMLIEYKADVNCVDRKRNWTSLHYAVSSANDEMVEVLLKEGADVNAKTRDGETALHLVSRGTSSEIIDMDLVLCCNTIITSLLEAGCDINGRTSCGLTPLCHARLNLCASSAYTLLQHGADIKLMSEAGKKSSNLKKVFDEHSVKLRIIELSSNIAKLKLEESESHDDCTGDKTGENGFLHKYIRQFGKYEFRGDFISYGFPKRCAAELISMQATQVDRYNSLCSIILKNPTAMSCHVLSESFKNMLESDGFDESFPLYGYLVRLQYKKGIERVNLMGPAKNSLEIIANRGLPDSCSEPIIKYLSKGDLKNLIKATPIKD